MAPRLRVPLLRLACVLLGTAAIAACGSAVPVSGLPSPTACPTAQPQSQSDSFNEQVSLTTAPSGLKYGDIRVGCGAAVKAGSTVTLEYTGWLSNGHEFDTSRTSQAFQFQTGQGQVITGFEDGLVGMRAGGKRRIVIPPALGYGAQGRPPVIPANATLVFDVEVLAVK